MLESKKDETLQQDGCEHFVSNHIKDWEKVLQRLEGASLTFSWEKSRFGQREILVIEYLCGPYGQKPSPRKVDVVQEIKECNHTTISLNSGKFMM